MGAMEDVLGSLSRTLPDAFDDTMNRIRRLPETRCRLAMSTLMWICYAERPLTATELGVALSIKPGQNTFKPQYCPSTNVITECCHGLVVFDSETTVIHFAHHSIQEYLTLNNEKFFGSPEVSLAETCLQYLMFDNFSQGPMSYADDVWEFIYLNPFLTYVARFWGVHAQRSESNPHVQSLTIECLKRQKAVAMARQVAQVIQRRRKVYWSPEECLSLTPLHIVAHFGLERLAREFLSRDTFPVDAVSKMGSTPLILAASRGNASVVELLLERGADPYIENWYGNSLHCAAESGKSNTISELIRHGMSPNSCDRYIQAPLWCVLDNDHADAFETLIKLGANITDRDETGRTPVHYAALIGSVNIIDLVIRRGWANIDDVSGKGFTALHYAAIGHRMIAFEKLLEAGADMNLPFKGGLTLLEVARASDNIADKDITAVLLKHGASSSTDSSCDTGTHVDARILD